MITVIFSKQELDAMAENEVLRQVRIIKRMREAGMPIIGQIAIERPERGVLTIAWDEVFEEMKITWSE